MDAQGPHGLRAGLRERLFAARRRALDEVPGSLSGAASPALHKQGALTYPRRLSGAGNVPVDLSAGGFSWLERARALFTPSADNPSEEGRWPRRFGLAALLAVGLAIQLAAEDAEVRQSLREGDTDAQMLTGELPLDAYADRGFAVFLRNMLINRPDLGADTDEADDAADLHEGETQDAMQGEAQGEARGEDPSGSDGGTAWRVEGGSAANAEAGSAARAEGGSAAHLLGATTNSGAGSAGRRTEGAKENRSAGGSVEAAPSTHLPAPAIRQESARHPVSRP